MAKDLPIKYAKILYKLTNDIEDENKLDKLLEEFVKYLHKRQALNNIEYVIDEYIELKNREENRKELKITFARDVSEDIVEKVKSSFEADEITAEVEKDASIIGGMIIEDGNKIIDGSIKTQLKRLKTNLL